jgi:PAS domain S-box-containing protein
MAEEPDRAAHSPQLHVLFVTEDEKEFSHLRDLVERNGKDLIHIEHLASVEEAMLRVQQKGCDLLLCSYHPGDDAGLRLARELHETSRHTPLIFVSDYVNPAATAAALQANANEWLEDPRSRDAMLRRALLFAIELHCKERQQQKADEMLRKLWRAVEQSAELIAITDRKGMIEYANPAFETVSGYSSAEMVGQSFGILKCSEESPETYQTLWDTILAGKVFRGVVANQKKNGEVFYLEKVVAPLRDAEGNITHFVSCDRDITERKKLEEQLQQAQKMDAVGRLAGGVAHDFNNLLMVISAYTELMLDTLAKEHPLRRNAEQIMTACRRAADLTRQLLAFSRKQMQALQTLDLNPVIQEICKMLPRLVGEDIDLVFVPGNKLGKVRADPIQIEQILMNLAANARDAMPGGGKLTVETSSVSLDETYIQSHSIVPPGDYVLLAVTDSGEGIAPEHMPLIFEPFYTTKAEGKGTGLGLATVYGIVKQNGGFIWVYSEPGLGTTFKIYLPQVYQGTERFTPVPPDTSPRGQETILLVEDEAPVRQSTREFLELIGYTVLEARHGDEALRISREYAGHIHLMITDVVMPNMGGAKLAGQLALERPAMQVLFVSGYAENTVLRHGPIDVTQRFLQKPFTLKALARKMRQILQKEVAAAASPN